MTTYWLERAWLAPGRVGRSVVVEVQGDRFGAVRPDCPPPPGAVRRLGLTLPGFANCHSHAFHRALRGHTQRETGSFWTWRKSMYAVAGRLDPDSYYALARATYEEMALTGITVVGEFHYLHHEPDGSAYGEPNAMGNAVMSAALDAGIRIALLDACYLSAGFGEPVEGVQRRFSDGDADRWAQRVSALKPSPGTVIGAAVHSVRAVPRDSLAAVAAVLPGAPLHCHLSEQVAENDGCLAAYGVTPAGLLAEEGLLSERLSAIHATHLTTDDLEMLGGHRVHACLCPTTERDLADGVGPAGALAAAGARLTIGSDSHAVLDPFEEMRAVELNLRLASQRRGHLMAGALLEAATASGHASLGFPDGGRIASGYWADLVTVDLDSVRTAGTGGSEETAVFAASPADVTAVVASGREVDLDSREVAGRLSRAVSAVQDAP